MTQMKIRKKIKKKLKVQCIPLLPFGLLVICLFTLQFNGNLKIFLEKPSFIVTNTIPKNNPLHPILTFCPTNPYNIKSISSLGLNWQDGVDFLDVRNNLTGVSRNFSLTEFYDLTLWPKELYFDFVKFKGSNGTLITLQDPKFRTLLATFGPCYSFRLPDYLTKTSEIQISVRNLDMFYNEDLTGPRQMITVNESDSLYHEQSYLNFLEYMASVGYYMFIHDDNSIATDGFLYLNGREKFVYIDEYNLNDLIIYSRENKENKLVRKGKCLEPALYDEKCFQRCLDDYLTNVSECLPISSASKNMSIKDLCISFVETNQLFNRFGEINKYCSETCSKPCVLGFWKSIVKYSEQKTYYSPTTLIQWNLDSLWIMELKEEAYYTKSTFLSDLGGSSGIFLGMPIIYLAIFPLRYCLNLFRFFRNDTRKKLLDVCEKILILSIALYHLYLPIEDFMTQEAMVSSRIQRWPNHALNSLGENPKTLKETLLSHLASRALDCHYLKSLKELCIYNCMLEMIVVDSSMLFPFVSIGDLPRCGSVSSTYESYEFLLPDQLYQKMDKVEVNISGCEIVCEYYDDAPQQDFKYKIMLNKYYYRTNAYRLLITLAGILGLYTSYSLIDNINQSRGSFQKSKAKINTLCIRRKVIQRKREIAKSIINFQWKIIFKISVVTMFLVCSTYETVLLFVDHPISASIEPVSIIYKDVPVLTICKSTSESTPQNLTKYWESYLDEEAYKIIGRYTFKLKHGGTILGKSRLSLGLKTEYLGIPESPIMPCITIESPYIYQSLSVWLLGNYNYLVSLHSKNTPPFVSNIIDVNWLDEVNIKTKTGKYVSLSQQSLRHDESERDERVFDCINRKLMKKLQCVPWSLATRYKSLNYRNCNEEKLAIFSKWLTLNSSSQYRQILIYKDPFKSNEIDGIDTAELESILRICYQKYRKTQRNFIYTNVHRYKNAFNTLITVELNFENVFKIKEIDLYSYSQYLSDIGSIIGVTIGLSLMKIFNILTKRFILTSKPNK